MKRLIALSLLVSFVGCKEVFFCVHQSDCVPPNRDTAGICFFDGQEGNHCANPVGDCPSGYRWDQYAGGSFANLCVDPPLVRLDGGVKD